MWWLSLTQLRISAHISLNFFSNVLENKMVLRGGLFLFCSPKFFYLVPLSLAAEMSCIFVSGK